MSESNNQQAALPARSHVWRDELMLIVGLLVFVGIVYALDSAFHTFLTGSNLLVAGVVIAFVPAFIWLAFFYLQDRLEPEPKQFVLGMFVLGACPGRGDRHPAGGECIPCLSLVVFGHADHPDRWNSGGWVYTGIYQIRRCALHHLSL